MMNNLYLDVTKKVDGNAKILIKRLYKQIRKIGNLKDNSLLILYLLERKRSKLLRGNILSSNDLDLYN